MPQITMNLSIAAQALMAGKPVAIPTETVYGLAAMIDKENAIRAIFDMKKRPLNHPLIVHVAQDWDLHEIVEEVPEYAQRLMAHFWPGPLTLVLRCKKNTINPLITGNQETVAIRSPLHPLAQKLLMKLGTPLVAPSANPFGKISPTTAAHVLQSFPEEQLTILDGGRCRVGIESTIIDATHVDEYQILRHGLIDEEIIANITSIQCVKKENAIKVPGKLDSHYQPQKNLYYFDNDETLRDFCQKREGLVYVIASKMPASVSANHFYPMSKDPQTTAFDLYYQLREADQSNALCIAIELPPSHHEWQGIRERILKAGFPYTTCQ